MLSVKCCEAVVMYFFLILIGEVVINSFSTNSHSLSGLLAGKHHLMEIEIISTNHNDPRQPKEKYGQFLQIVVSSKTFYKIMCNPLHVHVIINFKKSITFACLSYTLKHAVTVFFGL